MKLPSSIRFSQQCRCALEDAARRAREMGRQSIHPCHMMRALMDQSECDAAHAILAEMPDARALIQSVERDVSDRAQSAEGPLLLSATSLSILFAAQRESEARGNYYTNCSHLVIAILRNPRTQVTAELQQRRLDLEYVVHRIRVTTGRGLLPEEYILEPRAPRVAIWDFPERLRSCRYLHEMLDMLASLSDEEYQKSNEVQIALGRRSRTEEAIKGHLVDLYATMAENSEGVME